MSFRDGMFAALASAISIGSGASVGREGPVVHLGASLGSTLGSWFRLDRNAMRIMLGAGVAAGVAACFNAPIAGVFFAHELIIGHYALKAFAPVAIASITVTMISRLYFGDYPEFIIAEFATTSFWEMPAFALLGVIASLVAIAFIRLVPMVQDIYQHFKIQLWASPAIGGLLVGLIALQFPEVLGVGYEATNHALGEEYTFQMLVMLAIAKLTASVICLGSGMAGGVFSPSLFIGAMVGGAFLGGRQLTIPGTRVFPRGICDHRDGSGCCRGARCATFDHVHGLRVDRRL